MAAHVRAASAEAARRVPNLVDLPGPKLRTGSIEPRPEVVHLRPRHDELGEVITPARAWLTADGSAGVPPDAGTALPVAAAWLAELAPGDRVRFTDARGRRRELEVGAGSAEGRWVVTRRGAYLVSGTLLRATSAGKTRLGTLPRHDRHRDHARTAGRRPLARRERHQPARHDVSIGASDGTEERIAFAVAHADMIGLSFASTREDVRTVADLLARSGGAHLGLVLKIETRAGFDALPQLLAEALTRDAPCGVMIARGDLAVEVGRRMAKHERATTSCRGFVCANVIVQRLALHGMNPDKLDRFLLERFAAAAANPACG